MSKTTYLLLLFSCVAVYIIGGLMIPLMDIDASQYASISREMIERNSYLQIFDLGKDYLDKPPMLFWLSALSMKVFGIHDWAYRIPSIIFLGIALYSTFRFTQLFYSLQTARLATILLASCQAFFLIAHDVRTDTMLVGWVMLAIWLLAEWTEQKRVKYFFFAVAAIAGGMMTKGPIALVVPILCFVPHWVSKKKWSYLYHPIYLLGMVLLCLLLLPMSWGLYQQYDLQPGKLINNIPIESGLRFYYWTQSFGRYTGENFYREMSYPTFLLENMMWSFLPWIFVFLWAVIRKVKLIIKEGFFISKGEHISLIGFVLTYLVLSRSQAQLPHYIFVVFPLAAILTAAHWEAVLWHKITVHRAIHFFYAFHLFIFTILIFAIIAILIYPFNMAGWLAGILGMICLLVFLKILIAKQSMGKKWFYLSVVVMLGVNLMLNIHFYPNLLKYQWGNQLAKEIKYKGWDKNKLITYRIPNSNAFHFYGQNIFPHAKEMAQLKEGDWVVTDQRQMDSLRVQFPKTNWLYQSERFHVTMLTLPFLNPLTRSQETIQYGVCELRK